MTPMICVIDDREDSSRLAAVLEIELQYLGADVVLRLVAAELRKLAIGQAEDVRDGMIRNAERIEAVEIEP